MLAQLGRDCRVEWFVDNPTATDVSYEKFSIFVIKDW